MPNPAPQTGWTTLRHVAIPFADVSVADQFHTAHEYSLAGVRRDELHPAHPRRRSARAPHGCPMCRPNRELVINCVEAGEGRVGRAGSAPPAAVYATARGAGHRSGRRVSPAVRR